MNWADSRPRPVRRNTLLSLIRMGALSTVFFTAGCGVPTSEVTAVPLVDMTEMEPQVKERLEETRAAVLANLDSALSWGRFGMVAHAHELWAEAAQAYQRAQELDPSDVRWPYYLGDILSIRLLQAAVARVAHDQRAILVIERPPRFSVRRIAHARQKGWMGCVHV